jgi:hypothetical protein
MTLLRKISNEILTVTIAATLLTATLFTMSSNIPSIFAQQPPAQPQSTPQQQQQNAPLSFYLKLADNASTAQAAPQAAGSGTKNMTVAINVQRGPGGQQIPLPISALVPANVQPEDLQLCASLADGSESCQPLSGGQQGASIDLTQPVAAGGATPGPMATASPRPQTGQISPVPAPAPAPQSYPGTGGDILANAINLIDEMTTPVFTLQYADAQLISVEDTTINIPITVIIPINLNIQNAQICASVASSGPQTCQQIILNPQQTSFSPVDVNLAQPTPTITTQPTPTATAAPTPSTPTTPAATPPTTVAPTIPAISPPPTDQMQIQVCPPLCGPTPSPTATPNEQPQLQPTPPESTTGEQPSAGEDQPMEEGGGASSGETGSSTDGSGSGGVG